MRHIATGFAPFFLLFGRSPCRPIDIIFIVQLKNQVNITANPEHAKQWKTNMQDACKIANGNANQASSRKAISSVLQSGDRLLVRNLAKFSGSGELRSYGEHKVCVVVRHLSSDSQYIKFAHLIKDIFAHCIGIYSSLVTVCQFPVKLRFQRQNRFHQIHNRYLHHHLPQSRTVLRG